MLRGAAPFCIRLHMVSWRRTEPASEQRGPTMTQTGDPQMVRVTLPDGSVREVERGTTPLQIAETIGPRLAKAALAAKADGMLVDLASPLDAAVSLEIVTDKSPDALGVLRHSAAHALATAVRKVRPEAKLGFGPAIEDGFYYDFEVDRPFTPEELEEIERAMAAVGSESQRFERRVVDKA